MKTELESKTIYVSDDGKKKSYIKDEIVRYEKRQLKEIFDLATDIDYATLSVQLSLEDRKTLANTLLKLGYKKEIKDN